MLVFGFFTKYQQLKIVDFLIKLVHNIYDFETLSQKDFDK